MKVYTAEVNSTSHPKVHQFTLKDETGKELLNFEAGLDVCAFLRDASDALKAQREADPTSHPQKQ